MPRQRPHPSRTIVVLTCPCPLTLPCPFTSRLPGRGLPLVPRSRHRITHLRGARRNRGETGAFPAHPRCAARTGRVVCPTNASGKEEKKHSSAIFLKRTASPPCRHLRRRFTSSIAGIAAVASPGAALAWHLAKRERRLTYGWRLRATTSPTGAPAPTTAAAAGNGAAAQQLKEGVVEGRPEEEEIVAAGDGSGVPAAAADGGAHAHAE